MIDGVLDVLIVILILGIVFSIAFGFILPLVRSEVMQYDSQYDDKGLIFETSREGLATDPDEILTDVSLYLTTRYYTFEELMLLIDIQDDRLEQPTTLSLRNLAGLNDSVTDINDLTTTGRTFLNALQWTADNHLYKYYDQTMQPSEANRGVITLGTQKFRAEKSEMFRFFGKVEQGLLNYYNYNEARVKIHEPTTDNRVYYISYHMAIPDDSPFVKNKTTIKKSIDDSDMWWVEIDSKENGAFKGLKVDTFSEYQTFIKNAKSEVG